MILRIHRGNVGWVLSASECIHLPTTTVNSSGVVGKIPPEAVLLEMGF